MIETISGILFAVMFLVVAFLTIMNVIKYKEARGIDEFNWNEQMEFNKHVLNRVKALELKELERERKDK